MRADLADATATDLLRSTNTDDSLRMAFALTPHGRPGRPTDIADVVGLLCRADTGWITAQNVAAAGGMI